MKKSLVLVTILILIITGEACYLFFKNNLVKPIDQTKIFRVKNSKNSQEVQFWASRVAKEGGKKAYQQFKDEVRDFNPGKQHLLSHYFGEALYDIEGIKSVSVCDNSFAFGCYHSFLGAAIYSEGMGIVSLLNQKCIENLKNQSLGCQHGIGHGIAADLGYQYANLVAGLKICDKLPANDPIGGCTGGVFMEFNFQTLLAQDGRLRIYDKNNPLYPCSSLDKKFMPACYFWQSQWWGNVFEGNTLEKYRQIGILCESLTNQNEKQQCFIGSGNVLGQFANWKVDETIKLCHIMPSREGEIYCRAGAAGSFSAEPTAKGEANKLCQGFNNEVEKSCIKIGQISVGNIQ